MKKYILILTTILYSSIIYSQTQITKTKNTTTQAQQPKQLKTGNKLKLGIGTSDNGNFKFIYTNSNQLLNIEKRNLDGSFSNLSVQILSIEKVGNERLGYKTMLTVWIEDDSIPSVAMKAYELYCVKANKLIAEHEETLEKKKNDFEKHKDKMAGAIRDLKQKEVEDLERIISGEKAALEIDKKTLLKEVASMRWIVDYESALSTREITN